MQEIYYKTFEEWFEVNSKTQSMFSLRTLWEASKANENFKWERVLNTLEKELNS